MCAPAWLREDTRAHMKGAFLQQHQRKRGSPHTARYAKPRTWNAVEGSTREASAAKESAARGNELVPRGSLQLHADRLLALPQSSTTTTPLVTVKPPPAAPWPRVSADLSGVPPRRRLWGWTCEDHPAVSDASPPRRPAASPPRAIPARGDGSCRRRGWEGARIRL